MIIVSCCSGWGHLWGCCAHAPQRVGGSKNLATTIYSCSLGPPRARRGINIKPMMDEVGQCKQYQQVMHNELAPPSTFEPYTVVPYYVKYP